MSARAGIGRSNRLLAALVLGSVLLVFLFAPGGGSGAPRSASSSDEDGRLAAWLLLDELGLDPRVWTGAPGDLPRDGGLLWLPAEPPLPLGTDDEGGTPPRTALRSGDTESETGAGAASRRRDPLHYRRFLDEGGTLLLGWRDVERAFLVERLGLEQLAGVELDLVEGDDAQIVLTAGGEELAVAWGGRFAFGGLAEPIERSGFEPLLAGADGRPAALLLPVGRGTLALLPTDAFADNDRIDQADHGLLVVRLAEELARGGPVRFDEYALGGWRPDSPVDVALSPRLAVLSVHLLALAALALWALVWVREFPRDPAPVSGLSPLSRAAAQARLLLRGRRADVLARGLRAGVLDQLGRRAGLREARREGGGGGSEGDPAGELARLRSALEGQGAEPGPLAEWEEVLLARPVASAADLERLAADVDRLERRAAAPGQHRSTPRRRSLTRSLESGAS